MPRATWSGSISFGLVNVPVKVYSAVRDHAVHFHQVDKKSGSRIRYEKVAEKTGKEVEADQIELGYEMEKGKLVVLDPEELGELRPETTRTIDISDFVELSEVDPAYYDRTYWLAPDGEAATRAYRLLVAAMEDKGRAGIGMVVMRNKQYLAAIRARDGALAMSTMHFADEIVAAKDVSGVPSRSAKVDAKELKLATQIIDSMASEWKPEAYRDTYTEEVRRLVEAHAKGEDVIVEEPAVPQGQVLDLMAALEASLEAGRGGGGGRQKAAKGRAPKSSTSKSSTSKSSTSEGSTSKGSTSKGSTSKGPGAAGKPSAAKSRGAARKPSAVQGRGAARKSA